MGNSDTVNVFMSKCCMEIQIIIFMMEIMIISDDFFKVLQNKCCFTEGICVGSKGFLGGFGFWWNDFNVQIIFYTKYHVLVGIMDVEGNIEWYIVSFYV